MRQQASQIGMEAPSPRVRHHPFGGVAEVSAVQPDAIIVGQTAELSRSQCFVRTSASVPPGTNVSLKITHCGNEFTASGEVIYLLSLKGMGIKFAASSVKDEALLESWLEETTAEQPWATFFATTSKKS